MVEGKAAGGRAYWVVENFALPQRRVDAEAAAEEIREKVEEQLSTGWAVPDRDIDLEEVARELIGEATTSSLEYLNERASSMLRKRKLRYRIQLLVRQVLSDPQDMPELPDSAIDKDRYGVAVRVDRSSGGHL